MTGELSQGDVDILGWTAPHVKDQKDAQKSALGWTMTQVKSYGMG